LALTTKDFSMRLPTLRLVHIRSLGAAALVGIFGVALAAGTAPTATAGGFSSTEVIFDTITGNTPTDFVTATSTNWKAAQFLTPEAGDSVTLASVVLNLASNPLGTAFEVAIYDSRRDGSEPNNRVGQALRAPQTIVIGNNTFTPGPSFPQLDTSKEYWVVVKGGSSNVLWSAAGPSGVISPSSQTDVLTATRLNNGDWNSTEAFENPYMMTVTSGDAVPVPEPSTWAMGLAGLAFAGVSALRRRRRQG
jgi:hypothetical protein